ncbi:MAG: type II toxin-antitoxin system RelE/ParE family toxin [Chloroflexi bacterium]|nr:type II toxin-antitoxin system RelE/ParE family toxin [Chloroflexota bacterium]
MIQSFRDRGTEDIFDRLNSKEARRTCPEQLWRIARRKLDQLNAVISLQSLRIPPGNELEALKGDRSGQYSIRINEQFRICFAWTEDGPAQIEITDYH